MTAVAQYPLIASGVAVSDTFRVARPSDVALFVPSVVSAYVFQVQAGIAGKDSTSAQFVNVARPTGSLATFTSAVGAPGTWLNLGRDLAAFDAFRVVATQSFMLSPVSLMVIAKPAGYA